MSYYPNLEKIELQSYKQKLATAWLPPSRQMLKERLDERFEQFDRTGIKNVKELIKALKNQQMAAQLSKEACLQGNYLTILLRELNSLCPKPNKLCDFTAVATEATTRLADIGIKNTANLYERVKTKTRRIALASETGLSLQVIEQLTRLSDLSRIKWAGATFAGMLYELGLESPVSVAESDPGELHEKINQINRKKGLYKGQIGLNDIRIIVEAAKDVPQDIEY